MLSSNCKISIEKTFFGINLKSNSMEVSGTLFLVSEEQSGVSKNGNWIKRDFVLDIPGGKYPKKLCLSAWGDLSTQVKSIPLGTSLKVQFDLSSRESNGRWYTDVKAWKVELANGINSDDSSSPVQNDAEEPLPF
jgi:hypothetical protein